MKLNIPARIRRMSRRRQKVAIRRWLEKDLQRFVGQPNSQLVRAEVTKIVMDKAGIEIHADVDIQPLVPVDKIDISFVVTKPPAEPATEKERHQPSGSVPLSDVIAEFESTPEGKAAMDAGRQWVKDTFYGGNPATEKEE